MPPTDQIRLALYFWILWAPEVLLVEPKVNGLKGAQLKSPQAELLPYPCWAVLSSSLQVDEAINDMTEAGSCQFRRHCGSCGEHGFESWRTEASANGPDLALKICVQDPC